MGVSSSFSSSSDVDPPRLDTAIQYGALVSGSIVRDELVLPDVGDVPIAARVDDEFPIFDQGNIPSCVSQSCVAAMMITLGNRVMLSPAFNYYYTTRGEARGTFLASSLTSLRNGVCQYEYWPSDRAVGEEPSELAQQDALSHVVTSAHTLRRDLLNLKRAIVAGYGVIVAFEVDRQADNWFQDPLWQKRTSYVIPIAPPGEPIVAAHAVVIVGYDERSGPYGTFRARNAWGPLWGDQGYFYFSSRSMSEPRSLRDFAIITGACSGPNCLLSCPSEYQICQN